MSTPAVLHPDDLLMDEGPGLFPAGLQHRLAARGVPAIPGGVLGDRLGHGGSDEAVVELGALRAVVPGDAVALATSPCSGSDGSSRRSRRDTAGRSRTGSPARRSSGGARRRRWCCRRRAADDRRGSRDRPCATPGCAAARGWSPAARAAAPPLIAACRHRRPAAGRARRRRSRPATGRSPRPARSFSSADEQRLVPWSSRPACCPRSGRPGAAPRSGARARSPAPRSARAAWRPAPGRGPRSARRRSATRQGTVQPNSRHAGGDLRDLVRPMRLRVLRVGLEPGQRPCLDRVRSEAQGHSDHPVGWRGGFRGWIPHWIPLGRGGLLQGPAEATPGRRQELCFIGLFRRAGGYRIPGGFPKKRGCRWRIAALAPSLIRFTPGKDPYKSVG